MNVNVSEIGKTYLTAFKRQQSKPSGRGMEVPPYAKSAKKRPLQLKICRSYPSPNPTTAHYTIVLMMARDSALVRSDHSYDFRENRSLSILLGLIHYALMLRNHMHPSILTCMILLTRKAQFHLRKCLNYPMQASFVPGEKFFFTTHKGQSSDISLRGVSFVTVLQYKIM